MLKNKRKLDLIDNYVELMICIFDCKEEIFKCKNNKDYLEKLTHLCEELLILKDIHEKIFVKKKMFNNSLILLKMQLEDTLKQHPFCPRKNTSLEHILKKKKKIEDYISSVN